MQFSYDDVIFHSNFVRLFKKNLIVCLHVISVARFLNFLLFLLDSVSKFSFMLLLFRDFKLKSLSVEKPRKGLYVLSRLKLSTLYNFSTSYVQLLFLLHSFGGIKYINACESTYCMVYSLTLETPHPKSKTSAVNEIPISLCDMSIRLGT